MATRHGGVLMALALVGISCASSTGAGDGRPTAAIVLRDPCNPDELASRLSPLIGQRADAIFRIDPPVADESEFAVDVVVTDFRDDGLVADLGRLDAENRTLPMLLTKLGHARPLQSRAGAVGYTPTSYWFDLCAVSDLEPAD